MVQSGQLIYSFPTKRPFRLGSGELVGLSGIMFESAAYALLSEWRKSTDTDPTFFSPTIRLFGGEGVSQNYEPTSSGYFLEQSGEATYTDYINDMREMLRGPADGTVASIFLHIAQIDSDYSWAHAKAGYHRAYFNDTPSGRIDRLDGSEYASGDFNYPYYDSLERPPEGSGNFLGYLGSSGSLLDIDFDEVQYQPYPRFGKSRYSGLAIGSTNFFLQRSISPIWPSFFKTDGTLIHTTTTDDSFKYPIHNGQIGEPRDNYGDQSFIQSGYLRVDGDIIEPVNTKLRLINSSGFPDFAWVGSGLRRISNIYQPFWQPNIASGQIPGSRGFFKPSGGVSGGLYRSALIHTSLPSGILGVWPPLFNSSGMTATVGLGGTPVPKSISSMQVIDDLMWASSSSGIIGYSPINGVLLWSRLPVTNIDDAKIWRTGSGVDPLSVLFKSIDFTFNINSVFHNGDFSWAIFKHTYDNLAFDSSGIASPSNPDSSGFFLGSAHAREGVDGNIVITQKRIANETFLHIINPTFGFIRTFGGDQSNQVLSPGGDTANPRMFKTGFVGSNEYGIVGNANANTSFTRGSGIGLLNRIPAPPVNSPFTIGQIKPVIYLGGVLNGITDIFGDDSGNTYIAVDTIDALLQNVTYVFQITEDTNQWNISKIMTSNVLNGTNPRTFGTDGTRIHVHKPY